MLHSRNWRRGAWFPAVAGVLMASTVSGPAEARPIEASGYAKVIDGDSLQVGYERIRLVGIDAPEGRQTCEREGVTWLCGQEAARALRGLVGGREVRCIADARDRYKRLLAVCTVNGTNLNATMVERGWALAFVRYSHAYVGEEDRARRAKRGLWAGEFEKPWEWRRR